jgi:hypothetical protein
MDDLRKIIQLLLQDFLNKENQLLVNNSGEQAISHRLAVLLESKFTEWDVDCEYNRDQETIKHLSYAIDQLEPAKERNVVPDIIIHKRMTSNNLLVIEVKKSTNPETDDRDINKLIAFKEQLGYEEALFVRFLTGDKVPGIQRIIWV